MKGLSSTGFSLCSFDFSLEEIKAAQAEACAAEKHSLRTVDTGSRIGHAAIVKFV
jgi:hypothetical protein